MGDFLQGWVLIAIALLICPGLFAQGTQAVSSSLTLEVAVREGLARSPEIQRARAARAESGWRHFEVLGTGFLPKLSISALHYFDQKYTYTGMNFGGAFLTFPGLYPSNAVSVDFSLPLFDGLSNVSSLRAAALSRDAAEGELSRAEFQLRQDIRLAFYRTLATSGLQEVAKQNVKTLEDHLKQVEVRKGSGVATSYDILRVGVQLNEARADVMDATDAYETARRKLTELLGLESDERAIQGDLPIPDPNPIKDLKLSELPAARSDIKALDLKAEAAASSRQSALVWFVPSVSVGGNYTWYESQVFNGVVQDTGNYMSAYNVGLFLKWNLFDGGAALAKEREASYRTIQAESRAQAEKLKIPHEFEYWKRRYLSNTDHFRSKRFDITRSEESVRLAKEEERAGTRTSSETLDAELDLFRAKEGAVNALMNAVEAKIHLELVLGKEI